MHVPMSSDQITPQESGSQHYSSDICRLWGIEYKSANENRKRGYSAQPQWYMETISARLNCKSRQNQQTNESKRNEGADANGT